MGVVALWTCGLAVGVVQGDLASIGLLVAAPPGVVGLFLFWHMLESRPLATTLLLSVAAFLVDATFRFRDYSDKSLDAQIVVRLASFALILAVAIWNVPRNASVVLTPVYLMWTALYGWILLTTAWAVSPLFSAVAVVSLIAFHAFMLHVAANYDEVSVVKVVVFIATLVSLVSLLVFVFLPSFGRLWVFSGNTHVLTNRMRGITAAPNTIGAISGVALLLIGLYWRELSKRSTAWILAAVAICLLSMVLSQNRSTVVALVILIFAYHLLRPRRLHWGLALLALAAVAATLVIPFTQDLLAMLARSGKAEEITSGTNRGVIWACVIRLWTERPTFGWGYGSMLFILPKQPSLFMAATHAHNLFLESLVSTGLIGFGLFIASNVVTIVSAVRHGAIRPLCLLLFILFRGLTEAMPFHGVASFSALSMSLSVALVAVASIEPRRRPAKVRHARAGVAAHSLHPDQAEVAPVAVAA